MPHCWKLMHWLIYVMYYGISYAGLFVNLIRLFFLCHYIYSGSQDIQTEAASLKHYQLISKIKSTRVWQRDRLYSPSEAEIVIEAESKYICSESILLLKISPQNSFKMMSDIIYAHDACNLATCTFKMSNLIRKRVFLQMKR